MCCLRCAYLLVYLLTYLLISPELHFRGERQGLSLEASRATGSPGQANGSRTSFWRLFKPRAAQTTQKAPGPHLGGFAGHGRPRPPKWFQGLIWEAFRLASGPGHPNGSRASFWSLFGPRAAQGTQLARNNLFWIIFKPQAVQGT